MEAIKNCTSTTELGDLVEAKLEKYNQKSKARGESYAETAERLGKAHPIYDFLMAADDKWFELGA